MPQPTSRTGRTDIPASRYYIPTSSHRLKLVDRCSGELTNKRIRRDSCLSVDSIDGLVTAINELLASWNQNPRAVSLDGYHRIHRGKARDAVAKPLSRSP